MRFHGLLLLLIAALLGGCQTTHQFANPDASWQQSIGQLRYGFRQRVLIGDVVVRRRGGADFQLEFQKAAGFPLLAVRQEGGTTRLEGLLAHGKWQGQADAAPHALRSWTHLREALGSQAASPVWQVSKRTEQEGRLAALSLRYPSTGETFDFYFSH